ncbi:hypothetical protein GCM10010191_44860 [Actinomadura vinacea]|uniref:Thioredoxin domain-containing protein n=1 Tax=Actinomadura vinacea TaxID=115336 RepID=A0ABN3JCN0_9ACTN
MEGTLVAVVVIAVATVFGLVRRRLDGRLRVHRKGSAGVTGAADDGGGLEAADLGADLGERATLVQFSTAFCAPCRATRKILGEIAGMIDGVAHVEIDAESRLDLVRRLDVLRTPTVLILDARGRIVRRAAGQPRKADVIAALGMVIQ